MTNSMKKDSSGYNAIGLAPVGYRTVDADAEIPWLAIMSNSDIVVYWTDNSSVTATWPANHELIVTDTLRLSNDTDCFVY